MSQVPEDRKDTTSQQADWPLDQIKELALKRYVRFPFDEEDHPEGWKDLVREAFIVLDNLDDACKEILKERAEDRRGAARMQAAYQKLPAVVPFDQAVRYITGEKHTDRARSKFEKDLSYEARIVPGEGVSPKLSPEQKRQLRAQLKKWQTKGILRQEAIKLQSRYERYWPLVVAEQNTAKVRKGAKRNDKRRGAKPPDLRRTLMSVSKK